MQNFFDERFLTRRIKNRAKNKNSNLDSIFKFLFFKSNRSFFGEKTASQKLI